MPRVWQIACGETGRKYSELFLRHDVMCCGPGWVGAYGEAKYAAALANGQITTGELTRVRKFATEIQPGDLVLLRSGYQVEAIGLVVHGQYGYLPTFDDVFGWDLSHTQRVAWQTQLSVELEVLQAARPLFAGRKQIPTFTAVEDPAILQPITSLWSQCLSRTLADLPTPPPAPLEADDLCAALFQRGLGFDAVDRFRAAIDKQRRLIEWYRNSHMAGDRPTEHEVVAHIILPMLLALGWSEQLLAVEWRKIDLAIFSGTPTDRQHCRLVCEAKGMGHGLQDVLQQAVRYTESLQLTVCDKILLADGGRFYLYRRRAAAGWEQQPSGYLNVLKLRENHLLPSGTSAIDTILALTPLGIGS